MPQIEKAGGYSSCDGKCVSGLDVPIDKYDQRTQICYGSLAGPGASAVQARLVMPCRAEAGHCAGCGIGLAGEPSTTLAAQTGLPRSEAEKPHGFTGIWTQARTQSAAGSSRCTRRTLAAAHCCLQRDAVGWKQAGTKTLTDLQHAGACKAKLSALTMPQAPRPTPRQVRAAACGARAAAGRRGVWRGAVARGRRRRARAALPRARHRGRGGRRHARQPGHARAARAAAARAGARTRPIIGLSANVSFTQQAALVPSARGAGRGRVHGPVRASATACRGAGRMWSPRSSCLRRVALSSEASAVRRCMRCCTRSTSRTLPPRSATCSSTPGPLWCWPAGSLVGGGHVLCACAC